jgi:hypothetical protein
VARSIGLARQTAMVALAAAPKSARKALLISVRVESLTCCAPATSQSLGVTHLTLENHRWDGRRDILFRNRGQLKHVAEILCSGKAERAVRLGCNVVVADLDAERIGKARRYLRTREMCTRNADSTTDVRTVALENPVRTASDIFSGDRGELLDS